MNKELREKVLDIIIDFDRSDNMSPASVADAILAIFAEEREELMKVAEKNEDYEEMWERRALKAEAREAKLREALRRARADFAGPVAKLCEMTNTHPFTLAINEIDAALAVKEGK